MASPPCCARLRPGGGLPFPTTIIVAVFGLEEGERGFSKRLLVSFSPGFAFCRLPRSLPGLRARFFCGRAGLAGVPRIVRGCGRTRSLCAAFSRRDAGGCWKRTGALLEIAWEARWERGRSAAGCARGLRWTRAGSRRRSAGRAPCPREAGLLCWWLRSGREQYTMYTSMEALLCFSSTIPPKAPATALSTE